MSFNIPFRTGASQGSLIESILESLNESFGSAYNAEPGTVIYAENMALARTLADAWSTSKRFSNQFDPIRLTAFLERWESILKIVPTPGQSDNSRRSVIAAKWKLFNVIPNSQTVKDFILEIIPLVFVDILHITSTLARSTYPGHTLTIAGGASLVEGSWRSPISSILIRVYQALEMSDAEFYNNVNLCKPFLDNFIPAYTTFDWGRYGENQGTISAVAGDTYVYGVGTAFQTGVCGLVVAGEEIEVVTDANELLTLTVASVISDTELTVTIPVSASFTTKLFNRFGFFLDVINLDNSFLSN